MTPSTRFIRFNTVGLLGMGVQLASVTLLTALNVPAIVAVVLALGITLVHNFVWHRRWTWNDRSGSIAVSFARFVLANGLVSLAGNVVIAGIGVHVFGMPAPLATFSAIGLCGLVNYRLSDRTVFVPVPASRASARTPS